MISELSAASSRSTVCDIYKALKKDGTSYYTESIVDAVYALSGLVELGLCDCLVKAFTVC
jgi:3-methyladenine DNA glycosylase Tag